MAAGAPPVSCRTRKGGDWLEAAPNLPHSCARHRNLARPSPWARETLFRSYESFTARTRGGWIPVTSTGMREAL
ncbi:hypothetical protein RPHASCH2410_CH12155 [Rhizobium phaseoli Ch24-10]|nr:hypothetical protein RPHASCH2410_CH12155 [Rhizobium phaseoli Ch24-10]